MGLVQYRNNELIDHEGNPLSVAKFDATIAPQCIDGSLIRHLESTLFDPRQVSGNALLSIAANDDSGAGIVVEEKSLPPLLAQGCVVESVGDGLARIKLH